MNTSPSQQPEARPVACEQLEQRRLCSVGPDVTDLSPTFGWLIITGPPIVAGTETVAAAAEG